MLRFAMAALVVMAVCALLGVIGLPALITSVLRWTGVIAAILAAVFTLIGLYGRRQDRITE